MKAGINTMGAIIWRGSLAMIYQHLLLALHIRVWSERGVGGNVPNSHERYEVGSHVLKFNQCLSGSSFQYLLELHFHISGWLAVSIIRLVFE